MKLHFLGTTGYHPNNNRHTACVMLPELGVVFDAGTGMFRVRDLLQTKTLDIFLSHVHCDHVVGLTFLYDVLHEKEMERVTVHLAADKIDTIEQHLYATQLFPVKPNFELRPFPNDGVIQIGSGWKLQCIPVEHPGGCHAFRCDSRNRSFAYVTDTTASPNADYVAEIRGVDTLIHECYFSDGYEDKAALTGHSCLTPVAQVAAAAKAKRCFLVHVNPLDESELPLDLDSVKNIYAYFQIPSDQQMIHV